MIANGGKIQREPLTLAQLREYAAEDGSLCINLAIDFDDLACISEDGTLDGLNCWVDDNLFANLGFVGSDYSYTPRRVEENEIVFQFDCDVSDGLDEQ